MKSILATQFIVLLVALSAMQVKADSVTCLLDTFASGRDKNHTTVVIDTLTGTCGGKRIDITGIGLGLKVSGDAYLTISCPTVSAGNFTGRYYGIKIDIPILGAGLYSGRKGFCAIGLFGWSAALGGTGSVLTIY